MFSLLCNPPAILPAPIGAALIVYSGLKYIAKGVSALFDGKLTVEVLDGASISACLIQKNYNTAGTVMFQVASSELSYKFDSFGSVILFIAYKYSTVLIVSLAGDRPRV